MHYRTALLLAAISPAALAGPADYVYVPAVEYGEREIDFKFGTEKLPNGDRSQVASLGLGLGVTEYWFSELYIKREREGGEKVSIAEWENKFQLTEPGEYPIDLGVVVELEAPIHKNEPYEFKLVPLMQTEFGKVQLNGNLVFERKFGPGSHVTEMGYQWQAKYRWQKTFEFGLQSFGTMGKWNDWSTSDEQEHRLGPAIFGKFDLGVKQAIKYNAALLFGTSEAAANRTFRMQVEYEF
ncbi:MAG: hypothetical protein K8Q92_06390 [Methylophilales bacterium]|nr:hypothetical protein [Methylophilales bacterium]